MVDLIEKLSAYGVNVQEVMERFVNDEEFYRDCLLSFLDDPSFSGLDEALKGESYSTAFEHAHTLKGVAGNLGLTPLFDSLCSIVEPLRNKDYSNLDSIYALVQEEKKRLIKLINSIA